MKIIIWIACIFLAGALDVFATPAVTSSLSGTPEMVVGIIINFALLAAAGFLAKVLCDKYEKKHIHKEALKNDVSDYEYVYSKLTPVLKGLISGNENNPDALREVIRAARERNELTKSVYETILSHFFPD